MTGREHAEEASTLLIAQATQFQWFLICYGIHSVKSRQWWCLCWMIAGLQRTFADLWTAVAARSLMLLALPSSLVTPLKRLFPLASQFCGMFCQFVGLQTFY